MHDYIVQALQLDSARRSAASFFAPEGPARDPKLVAFEGKNEVQDAGDCAWPSARAVEEVARSMLPLILPEAAPAGLAPLVRKQEAKRSGWIKHDPATWKGPARAGNHRIDVRWALLRSGCVIGAHEITDWGRCPGFECSEIIAYSLDVQCPPWTGETEVAK